MISYRNRKHYYTQEKTKSVSAYLDINISTDQIRLLNPTPLDTVVGFVMKDSQGEGAKKRLPQRRLNFIDSKISAHCCVLNSPERLHLITQANEVAAIMGDLEADRIAKNIVNKNKRKEEAIKKTQKLEEKKRQAEIKNNEISIEC